MKWLLHQCPVCGGDLHDDLLDPGSLSCLMCGRSWTPVQLVALIGQQAKAEVPQ